VAAVRGASKQSRWPSLLSLFNISTTTLKPGQVHRPSPNRDLSTSRQFQSEMNVPAAADRKQYGGPAMTLPKERVTRPSSALTRPTFVAVDIPLQVNTQAGASSNVVDKGKEIKLHCLTCNRSINR